MFNEYQELRSFLKTIDNPQTPLSANLSRAINEELTKRQKEAVISYYIKQNTMQDTAIQMGVTVSTVSRTIKRARGKLKKCLRYGAIALLNDN